MRGSHRGPERPHGDADGDALLISSRLLGARPTQTGDARRRASLLSFWGLVPTR